MSTSAPPHILVADDDRVTIAIISAALRDEFEVVVVTTGAEVLERVAAGGIDLVLLDVVMPGLDGFEICRRLRSDPKTSKIPVIFVTSLEESADENLGFSVGAVDYIQKPIKPSIVRARVRTHLELKRSRDQFEELASIDSLTGVANRRRFDAVLSEEWRRSLRGGRWLSLALLDVDHFKQFNDRFGHLAGDQCLRAVASSLMAGMRRAGEMVARYGGEEFGVVLPEVEPAAMYVIVRRMLQTVCTAKVHEGEAAGEGVTASVGAVSLVPSKDGDLHAALGAVDAALYEAKGLGRDRGVHLDLMTDQKTVILRPLP